MFWCFGVKFVKIYPEMTYGFGWLYRDFIVAILLAEYCIFGFLEH